MLYGVQPCGALPNAAQALSLTVSYTPCDNQGKSGQDRVKIENCCGNLGQGKARHFRSTFGLCSGVEIPGPFQPSKVRRSFS